MTITVNQDFVEAIKWYRLAAEQGFAEAHYNFGVMYYNGEGVPKDFAKAREFLRKAAERGYADAQKILREMK